MKKLTLKTKEGCLKLTAIFIVVLMLSALIARAFQNDFGKIKVEQVTFDSRGAAINAELYYPVGTNDTDSLPGIVVTHGGGCALGVTKGIAAELARRGFVVLNVSAYGTGLSDQPDYDESGQGKDGFDMLKATNGVYDSVCFLKTLRFVDKTRIGAVGHSMGAIRTFSAARLDAGYYSLNDIMLNILYNTFGLEITEEQLDVDADSIAAEMLNSDQLEHYNSLKESEAAKFDTRIKAAVPLGVSTDLLLGTGKATVNVAGHEVLRSIQTNIAYVSGNYDVVWGFTESEGNRAEWYAENGFSEGEWYCLDDNAQSSSNLGAFPDSSIVDNAALADAIDNGTTRILISTGDETHSKEFFSNKTIAVLANYFSQTLNYNRGDLTDSATVPLAPSSQIWAWRAVFNFVAMLAMFGLLLSVGSLILKTKKYGVCVCSVENAARPDTNKAVYWAVGLFTVVVTFVAIYLANIHGIMLYDPGMNLPLGRGAALLIYFLLIVAGGSLVALVFNVVLSLKKTGKTGLANLNFRMPVLSGLKCLAFSIILIIVGYTALAVSEYFFGQDFRLWMISLSDMKVEWWTLGLRYALILFPLYLVISSSVNYTIRRDIPEWKDTLITVIINSAGIWLCCLVNYILARTSFDGALFSNFQSSYQYVLWVPITVYLARKMYNLTKNVWTGALLNTFIITWSIMSSLGVNDTFWGQHWVGNFFNI